MLQFAFPVPAQRLHQKFDDVGIYGHDDLSGVASWIQLQEQLGSGK